jgi:hypothetical protein
MSEENEQSCPHSFLGYCSESDRKTKNLVGIRNEKITDIKTGETVPCPKGYTNPDNTLPCTTIGSMVRTRESITYQVKQILGKIHIFHSKN